MKTKLALVLLIGLHLATAQARPVPQNLGNGLDKLVENNLIQQGKITAAPATSQTSSFSIYKASVAKQAASFSSRALTDATTGRYLVEIMPNGRVPVSTLQASLQ